MKTNWLLSDETFELVCLENKDVFERVEELFDKVYKVYNICLSMTKENKMMLVLSIRNLEEPKEVVVRKLPYKLSPIITEEDLTLYTDIVYQIFEGTHYVIEEILTGRDQVKYFFKPDWKYWRSFDKKENE